MKLKNVQRYLKANELDYILYEEEPEEYQTLLSPEVVHIPKYNIKIRQAQDLEWNDDEKDYLFKGDYSFKIFDLSTNKYLYVVEGGDASGIYDTLYKFLIFKGQSSTIESLLDLECEVHNLKTKKVVR